MVRVSCHPSAGRCYKTWGSPRNIIGISRRRRSASSGSSSIKPNRATHRSECGGAPEFIPRVATITNTEIKNDSNCNVDRSSDSSSASWCPWSELDAFPPWVRIHDGILPGIPIDTGPIHQPQRVCLQIPSRCRIVIPHPVLVQAGFGLEPLAGEPRVGGDGAGADTARHGR